MRPTALADVGSLANDQATSMVLSARERSCSVQSDSDSGSSCTTEYSWRRQVIEYPWAEPSFTVRSALLAPWRSSSPVTVCAPLPVPDAKRIACGQRGLSLFAALGHHQRLGEALKCPSALPNQRDRDGDRTPLHWCAARGHAGCVKKLLAAGADPELTDAAGRTAAALAKAAGYEALAFRIERGPPAADEKQVYEGVSPLSLHAALNQPTQLKREISEIEREISEIERQPRRIPSQRDCDGDRTPLHWAAARGNSHCAALLVAAGADVLATDRAGLTPASLAFSLRQWSTYAFLAEREREAGEARSSRQECEDDDA